MVDRNRFEILEENIESIIDHCREAGIVVCDYQPSVSFQKKINDLVYKLQDVDRMQVEMQDVHVPIELFSKIDAGQNPQLYTRECMEQALAKNEAVRGKLDSLRRFRVLLMSELSRQFPNEMAKYRAVRGDPEAPVTGSVMSSNSQSNGSGAETGPESISLR
ncbi:Mediator of RNA polymerase II transcription subunit 10 [Schistosoma japonicum]|uniref:Mediator of RNA polymerase II transcription subunit 10 n=1 Tax=Schistosoma japonicum TaxID=6182 RepID=Q86E49_SCHJA|nr:SJCHGC01009 protein [Schistosoma japonicum]KAH8867101.1 Mediator of RNA polymerase II transcription subunit 10 [Schistosoma japonicum]KAH8867102.1 Mediator of RNA polymerase II transcription subunit 10 [Schistosoma japonicum]TNN18896.1 Mediator of RNA polymerase II transcription subunit 10 [Schistosoma japonicum]TNN18897.1 Mediator of RNA polymerase II transcription subunit 10 [Schistosoma japonicum]